MDTKNTARKPIRAVNFKHWENDNDCELIVCIGSDASTKSAKAFLEEEYRLSWVQHTIGKVKLNETTYANPLTLYEYAKERHFHANPDWSKEDELFLPLKYKEHIDDEKNQDYRPPVVITNSDMRKGNKIFLNMKQSSVRFIQVGKFPNDCKKILIEKLLAHRIRDARIDAINWANQNQYHEDRYLHSSAKTIDNLTEQLQLHFKEFYGDAWTNDDDEALLPESAESDTVDGVIERLNKQFVRVTNNGKNYVTRTGIDNLGRPYLEFFTYKEFVGYFIHEPQVHNGEYDRFGNPVMESPAMIWLKDPRSTRSDYGVTFYPKDIQFHKGRLNAYYGLGVTPTEYDIKVIQPYLDHVEKIICSGNKTYFEYVLNWCAHMLQIPEEKPETAIVLKAAPGTGKGTFVKPLGKIIGSHYLHATDAKHIVGKFNKSMENKILVFGDEFFSGSKEASDKLKGKITEDTQTIERKGIDTIETPDYARVILASNHENIVRIEVDDRRYLFLEVSDDVKQNHEYFGELAPLVKSDHFAGMLADYLLKRDIKGFNPRAVPKTEALAKQKLDNLEPLDKWLLHCLRVGSFTSKASLESRVNTNEINQKAQDWLDANKISVYGDLSRKVGHALKDYAKRVRLREGEERIYVYEFKRLEDMRTIFNNRIGYEVEY